MKYILILIIGFFFSCENKKKESNCTITFKISKNENNFKGIFTNLQFNKNVLEVSIYNSKKDTLIFITPRIIFSEDEKKIKYDSNIIVKPYFPNIITDRITSFYVIKNEKRDFSSIDLKKNREAFQEQLKLPPYAKYVKQYHLNCKKSDTGKYKILFFRSNRFDRIIHEKTIYPENGYMRVR